MKEWSYNLMRDLADLYLRSRKFNRNFPNKSNTSQKDNTQCVQSTKEYIISPPSPLPPKKNLFLYEYNQSRHNTRTMQDELDLTPFLQKSPWSINLTKTFKPSDSNHTSARSSGDDGFFLLLKSTKLCFFVFV